MKLDKKGYDLIKGFEGLELIAYKDSAGIWTIGYGNTTYENGVKVKRGDSITRDRAEILFKFFADKFATQVDTAILVPVSQNQFNACVSFAYNVGIGAFRSSTLLRKLNACPTDGSIRKEFMRWVNAGGKVVDGLINRRYKEANLYFTKN